MQPISKPQSCDNSDSQVIAECDLTAVFGGFPISG